MPRDYVEALKRELPRGRAWTRSIFSNVHKLLKGFSIEFARVEARAEALLLEMLPNTATELLPGWERVLGIPDACAPLADTLSERRIEATNRFIQRGEWATDVGLGFLVARIVERGYAEAGIYPRRFHFPPWTCESACDDYLYSEDAGWIFVYQFDVISIDEETDARVECELQSRYAQSHLGLTFAWPLFDFSDGTFTRTGVAVAKDPDKLHETALAANEMGEFYYGI